MTDKSDENLDELEEKLKKEEQESRKIPMPVSGRSVFEIKKRMEEGQKKE